MKKFAPLISFFLIICFFAGCGGEVVSATLPNTDITASFTLPEKYSCKESSELEGVSFAFYKKTNSQSGGWSMILSLGESSPQVYGQYIKMVSSGGGITSAKKFGDTTLFSFSGGNAMGNKRGIRLIDDKYLAVLSAQNHVEEQDIISILNSIKIG